MIQKTLPGFKEIEFADIRSLYINSQELIREGSTVEAYGNFTGIPVVGLIGCKVETDIVSGETIYKTVLNFTMKDCGVYTQRLLSDIASMNCCFRLTDMYKEKYLLGTDKKPHPTGKCTHLIEDKPNGMHAYFIEIQYVNTFSILQLLN